MRVKMSINPTAITTRNFHIDLEKDKMKKKESWEFDVHIEHEALKELSSGNQLKKIEVKDKKTGKKITYNRSKLEKEYDVIRSLVEKVFEEHKNTPGGKFDISVSKSSGGGPVRVDVKGKAIAGVEGFQEFDITPTVVGHKKEWKTLRVVETTNHQTLIEKYSEKTPPKGRFLLLKKILNPFFTLLGKAFKNIDVWWKHIMGMDSEEKMPWNLELLAEICGAPKASGNIPATDALKYIKQITEKSNPRLGKNLDFGLEFQKLVEKAQDSIKKINKEDKQEKRIEKETHTLGKKLTQSIEKLSSSPHARDFLILPMAYEGKKEKQEALLKISKEETGKIKLELLNPPESLSKSVVGRKGRNIEIPHLKEGSAFTFLESLVQFQLNPKAKEKELVKLLKGTKKAKGVAQPEKSKVGTIKKVAEETLGEKKSEEFRLGIKLRMFVDACNVSDNWLKDPEYRNQIEKTCYELVKELDSQFKGRVVKSHLSVEHAHLQEEIKTILDKIDSTSTKIKEITSYKLDELGSSYFPEIDDSELPDELGDLVNKPLTPDYSIKILIDSGATEDQLIQKIQNEKGYGNQAEKFDLSQEIKNDMRRIFTYASGYGNPNFTDVNFVQNFEMCLPALAKEDLTRGEKFSLAFTLHSSEYQSQAVGDSYFYSSYSVNEAKAEAELARAHYTFQAIIDHSFMCRHASIQGFLNTQIFDERRIDTLLQSEEGIASLKTYLKGMYDKGEELIETQVNFSSFEKNYTTGLYLFGLISQIKNYVGENRPDLFDELFGEGEVKDPEKILLQDFGFLARKKSPQFQTQKALYFSEFLSRLYDKLSLDAATEDDLNDILLAQMLTAFKSLEGLEISNPATKAKVRKMKNVCFNLAALKVKKKEFAGIKSYLNNIGSQIAGEDYNWEISRKGFPVLTAISGDQEVQVDLLSGEVFLGGERAARLPVDVARDENVLRLHPDAGKLLWKVETEKGGDESKFIYTDPNRKDFRLIVEIEEKETEETVKDPDTGNDVKIKKTEILYHTHIEKEIEGLNGEKEWAVYKYFPSQKALEEGMEPVEDSEDLPLSLAAAIGNKSCWLSRSKDVIFVCDPAGREKFAELQKIEVDGDEGSKLILADGSSLLKPKEKPCKRFSVFEKTEKLMLFGQEGKVNHIKYPGLVLASSGTSLSYDLTKKKEGLTVTSPLFKGWSLAPHGKVPGSRIVGEKGRILPRALPRGFTSFQLLTSGALEKVLIAGKELKVTDATAGTLKGTYSTETEPVIGFKAAKVYEYSINSETNRLEALSSEAYLNLVYISLVHQDYEGALFYLDKARSGTGDTEGFNEIFGWINKWNPSTPEGKAVKLKILCLEAQVFRGQRMQRKLRTKSSGASGKEPEELEKEKKQVEKAEGKAIKSVKKNAKNLFNALQRASLQKEFKLTRSEEKYLKTLGIGSSQKEKSERRALQSQIGKISKRLKPKQKLELTKKKVSSVAGQKYPVLGRANQEKFNGLFDAKEIKPKKIDDAFFDDLEQSANLSFARVAKMHREDLNTSLEEVEVKAGITKTDTEELLKQVSEQKGEFESYKELRVKNALSLIEAVGGAGTALAKRMLGEEAQNQVDTLIKIWRSGDLQNDWDNNPLKKFAKRELKPAELVQLDWFLTEYMATKADIKHLEAIEGAAKGYIVSCKNKEKGDPDAAQGLFDLVNTKREYVVYNGREAITVSDVASILAKKKKMQEFFLKKLSTHLASPEKANKILKTIERYAELEDSDLQIEKVIKEIDGWESLIQSMAASDLDRMDFSLIASDEDYRDLLSIEYSVGIILRGNQVDTFRDMLSDANGVRQLGMGGGKSKVILPLLAKRKSTGDNLVALLLPEALYETNRRDLDATNRELFGQDMFCFEFNRFADVTANDLEEIRLKMLQTIESKGFMATTKSSLLSFRNSFLTNIQELESTKPEEREEQLAKIQSMAKILTLLKERMDIIADEVDSVLDVRKEVNFAIGNKTAVSEVKSDVGLAIMEIIFKSRNKKLRPLKTALENNTQALIPPDDRKRLLRLVVEEFCEARFPDYDDKAELVDYITQSRQFDAIPEDVQALKLNVIAGDDLNYKEIASMKAFLSRGFGITFGKTGSVDYGRELDSDNPFTIPYKASNTPSIGSEFDDEIERISYTLQDYCYKDISTKLIMDAVAQMSKDAQTEYSDAKKAGHLGEGGGRFRYEDTPTFKTFKALVDQMVPDDPTVSRNLKHYLDDEESVLKLTNIINQTPLSRMVFCKTYTLVKRMEFFDDQVSSKAEDLVDMVHGFGGFTGTPWNLHTFHDKINAERNLGVDGKTYKLLLQYDSPVRTIDLNPRDPVSSLSDQLNFKGEEGYRALIDTGAYLRGVNNGDFIKGVMKRQDIGEEVTGIYFDESDKIVGVKKGSEPLPLDQMPPGNFNDRISLYDQNHTVGADIKQGKKAKAVVTIGESTSTRDLFQAVWRLRELHKEQRVEFVVTDEVKRLILGDVYGTREPNIKDILAFCLKQEASREADDNYRAETGKIRGSGSRAIFDKVVSHIAKGGWEEDVQQGVDEVIELSHHFGKSFIKKRPEEDESMDEYAAISKPEDPEKVFGTLKISAAEELETIVENFKIEGEIKSKDRKAIVRSLNSKAEEIATRENPPKDWMPPTVDITAAAGGGEVEAEAEVEVAVQTEIQLLNIVEEEEEIIEEAVPPAKEAGGNTQISPGYFTTAKLDQLKDISDADLGNNFLKQGINAPMRLCRLQDLVGCFDPNIFINTVYEGRLNAANLVPLTNEQKDAFDRIGESGVGLNVDERMATDRAKNILHSQRLPIEEAIFMKGAHGWRVVFSGSHDGYPAFSKYPEQTGSPAALVKLTSLGPIFVSKNNAFEDAFDTDEDDRKKFYELFVQMKFLKGEVNYETAEEKEALQRWFDQIGPDKARALFEKGIRPTKDAGDQQGYAKSSLKILFDEWAPI